MNIFFPLVLVIALSSTPVRAQIGGGGGIGGGNNNVNNAGITIDANGLVTRSKPKYRTRQLAMRKMEAFTKDNVNAEVATSSELRKVSLVQLEKECERLLDAGEDFPLEVQYLAGLHQINYVFVYPEANDIVIAGPAEAFAPDHEDRMVGLNTGRPCLRIDDLVVALRAIREGQTIGCSIDPDNDRLAQMQDYVRQTSSRPTSASAARRRFTTMSKILGHQTVRIEGIPADTHYAAAMLEADYRMKLISLGLEKPGVRGLRSHLSMLRPGGNSMQRWWFVPLYDAFYTTDSRDAFELRGQRIQLSAQEEVISSSGARSDAAFTRVSTKGWAKLFTDHVEELAEVSGAFAELQNLVDVAIICALMQNEQFFERADWQANLFRDVDRFPIPKSNVPKHVHSVANSQNARGGYVMGLVGGGVTIRPFATIRTVGTEAKPEQRIESIRKSSSAETEAKTDETIVWWWD